MNKDTKRFGGIISVPPDLQKSEWLKKLPGLLYSGEPLRESNKSEMQDILGYDLQGVLVHETWQAGEIARKLGASAFAVGRDVFSEEGKLSGDSSESKALLAHELSHVVQQTMPLPISQNRRSEIPALISEENLAKDESGCGGLQRAGPGPENMGNIQSGIQEAQARVIEQFVRNSETPSPAGSRANAIDSEEIADLVYRKMQNDLLIQIDRARRM